MGGGRVEGEESGRSVREGKSARHQTVKLRLAKRPRG